MATYFWHQLNKFCSEAHIKLGISLASSFCLNGRAVSELAFGLDRPWRPSLCASPCNTHDKLKLP